MTFFFVQIFYRTTFIFPNISMQKIAPREDCIADLPRERKDNQAINLPKKEVVMIRGRLKVTFLFCLLLLIGHRPLKALLLVLFGYTNYDWSVGIITF